MRLIRFLAEETVRPGIWKDGRMIDIQKWLPGAPDIGEAFFRDGWMDKVAAISDSGERIPARLTCPLVKPSKIICLGKNYAEHAKEGGFDMPERPLLFSKAPSAMTGPFDPIILPRSSADVDWEVELAVVIGKECKRVSKRRAMDVIAGFTVMNDVSGRQAQFADSQWFRGKSFDTFAPLGPCIITPDEIGDLGSLRLETRVNGELMQAGSTRDLIFDIPTLIENISEDMTLLPGDIISTGTPSGVGFFRKPPIVLKAGDLVQCTIEPIGSLINAVIAG
ncbi:MAG: fumarylacetoacetate hydrolase family protein [Desulfatirhabdiaceae bacterium]